MDLRSFVRAPPVLVAGARAARPPPHSASCSACPSFVNALSPLLQMVADGKLEEARDACAEQQVAGCEGAPVEGGGAAGKAGGCGSALRRGRHRAEEECSADSRFPPCPAAVQEEAHEQLQSNDAFRAEYYTLWETQRKTFAGAGAAAAAAEVALLWGGGRRVAADRIDRPAAAAADARCRAAAATAREAAFGRQLFALSALAAVAESVPVPRALPCPLQRRSCRPSPRAARAARGARGRSRWTPPRRRRPPLRRCWRRLRRRRTAPGPQLLSRSWRAPARRRRRRPLPRRPPQPRRHRRAARRRCTLWWAWRRRWRRRRHAPPLVRPSPRRRRLRAWWSLWWCPLRTLSCPRRRA